MWCDAVGHIQENCVDFAEAIRANVGYLWNVRVHARNTRKSLGAEHQTRGNKVVDGRSGCAPCGDHPLLGVGGNTALE